MKRSILSILFLGILIGFSGCTKKVVKPNIPDFREYKQIKSEKDMLRYKTYNGKNYQILTAFEDTVENRTKMNNILKILEEKINTKQKLFSNNPQPYTHDEQLQMCKKRVLTGMYGRYSNIIERDDLIIYCMDKTFNERKNHYAGITSSAEIKNNVLVINSKVGMGKFYNMTSQTVKTVKINKTLYLIIYLSSNTAKDEILYIDTNLLKLITNKKIKTNQSPFKIDFNKLSKVL